jgi:hypothetical protein
MVGDHVMKKISSTHYELSSHEIEDMIRKYMGFSTNVKIKNPNIYEGVMFNHSILRFTTENIKDINHVD